MKNVRPISIGFCLFIIAAQALSAQDAAPGTPLGINTDSIRQMQWEQIGQGGLEFQTLGNDPAFYTGALEEYLPVDNKVLSFDYFCPKGLNHLQISFGAPFTREKSMLVRNIPSAEGWVTYSKDLSEDIGDWGKPGDFLRIDLGSQPGVNIQMRNLRLRPMSKRELEISLMHGEAKIGGTGSLSCRRNTGEFP